MGNSFQVVTDVKKIARLNERLAVQLRKKFRVRESREITYPAGHHTGVVFFEYANGTAVRAWSPHTLLDKDNLAPDKLLNFVLAGEPGSSKWMEISVQLNFPATIYNRRMAGAFVVDERGDLFIAHRGKLTKGNAALKKEEVFREFAARTIEADDDGQISKLILISALDDPNLADRLWSFGEEAREVATRLSKAPQQQPVKDGLPSSGGAKGGKAASGRKPASSKDPLLTLRDYFDEYAGEGVTKGHGGGKRTVEHGDVVKALEAQLRDKGKSQKAQAIDLAIVAGAEVDLYEVKTSARTTDVYTGVGQLLIHGECLTELLELPVRRHLVLPEKPKASHERHLARKADINVVLFSKDDGTYRFDGLG
ncbi:hypothetical protein [Caldimonas tepidiphila]|uniref:hypothetical protein n=1 Tax=Caldimonas tepidiphila TaxID=2315841 RepID=UPI000E5B7F67|nr:hypothetical protein [Caldimonas tepidiphila]